MNIVILGLSITSSWGNGHATTYRSLVKGLHKRGHNILFLERDMPWYASNRDMPDPEFCTLKLYDSPGELEKLYHNDVKNADCVILGSYVPDGIAVGKWLIRAASGIKAFYDIDTPVTLAALSDNKCAYLDATLIPEFDLYLSFSSGPALEIFVQKYGSPSARQFYCSVDPDLYYPVDSPETWDLGYLGTYSDDRQPSLEELLIEPARKLGEAKFVVAGPQYPSSIAWSDNIQRIEHLPPDRHVSFYNSQRFTLNITREDMINMGYSPSVRLFEAAACGVPVISDWWDGLDTVFKPGEEIFISRSAEDTISILKNVNEKVRITAGEKARNKILKHHTGEQRATELENYVAEAFQRKFIVEKIKA